MITEVTGFIVSELEYGETSKILTIITKEHGTISVISKGCKTTKSPLRSVSSKLIHGVFHIYYKEGKLSTLKSVDVIDRYKNIYADLKMISYASLLLELSSQVIKQNDDSNIYDILKMVKIYEELFCRLERRQLCKCWSRQQNGNGFNL